MRGFSARNVGRCRQRQLLGGVIARHRGKGIALLSSTAAGDRGTRRRRHRRGCDTREVQADRVMGAVGAKREIRLPSKPAPLGSDKAGIVKAARRPVA